MAAVLLAAQVGFAVADRQREVLLRGIVAERAAGDGGKGGAWCDGAEGSRHAGAGVGLGDLRMTHGAGVGVGVPGLG